MIHRFPSDPVIIPKLLLPTGCHTIFYALIPILTELLIIGPKTQLPLLADSSGVKGVTFDPTLSFDTHIKDFFSKYIEDPLPA